MVSPKKALLTAFLLLLLPAAFALDKPDVTSTTHPENEWSAGKDIIFKWGAVDAAKEYCYVLDDSPSTEAPDEPCTQGLTVTLPQKIFSGDYYFHIKAKGLVAESETGTYHIKLDIEAPERPILSGEAKPDGSIELTWEAVKDDASGIKEYHLYRSLMGDIDIRKTPIHATIEGDAASFTDSENMDQSRTYHYTMRAVDNSGNIGAIGNEVHIQTVAKCDLEIVFGSVLSSDGKTLQLSISSNESIYHGKLVAELPNGSTHTFFEEAEPFSEWAEDFDLKPIGEGYIDFSLQAKEFFGDDCGVKKRFIYDVTDPSISFVFPRYNDKVSETVPLQVRAEDQGSFKSGLKSVTFYLKENSAWSELGKGEETEENFYEFGWDTLRVENGKQELKAIVLDEADNMVEASKVVNVLNAFEGPVDMNSAMVQALQAREAALVSSWGLASNAIYSDSVDDLLEEAQSKLDEAGELAELGGIENETNAKGLIAEAIVLYQQSQKVVSASVYKQADFVYNKEQVDILFSAAGISGPMAGQAKQAVEKYNPNRQLQILEVVDDNATYYRALIVASFELDVNILKDHNIGDDVIQIIEVVPKEFAEYAAELDSNVPFTVLDDDPKLSFTLKKEHYRAKKLVYALKNDLSQAQADSLIEENIVNKFVAPPVMLPVSAAGFGFAFPALDFGIPVESIILGIEIAAVLSLSLLIVIILNNKRHGKEALPFGHFASKKKGLGFEAKKEKKKEKKPGKPKKPFSGLKMPKLRKKDETPLSVFGKK